MKLLPWGRLLIILAVLVTCGLVLITSEIKLGLDLQGGSHFLIKVHADEAVERDINNTYNSARRLLTEENNLTIIEDEIYFDAVRDEDTGEIELQNLGNQLPFIRFDFATVEEADQARSLFDERFGGNSGYGIAQNGESVRLVLQKFYIDNLRATTVEKVRQAIEQRINTLGVSEPNIVISGNAAETQRIILQLAGEENPEEAKTRIQTPGRLEFRMVHYENGQPVRARTDQLILERYDGNIPTGTELVPEYDVSRAENAEDRNVVQWYLINTDTQVDSQHLVDAMPRRDQRNNALNIAITLNAQGGERMRKMSRENVDKLLAVVLDGEAIEVATIQEELGSDFLITGRFSQRDADNLVTLLRTGALPASMHFMEDRSVGPALGQDSIRMGFQAFIWGLGVVALFMILYYRLSGLLAVLVLSFNILIIMAFLAMVEAVLTLPGIAGIILTIGMAVDANVIIFERIREERLVGRSVIGSVDTGFGKAFSTIFDANITTLIAAIFLFQFGTGPIKGFATTITIGILASMFTAVFVARAVFDSYFALKNNKVSKLSI